MLLEGDGDSEGEGEGEREEKSATLSSVSGNTVVRVAVGEGVAVMTPGGVPGLYYTYN